MRDLCFLPFRDETRLFLSKVSSWPCRDFGENRQRLTLLNSREPTLLRNVDVPVKVSEQVYSRLRIDETRWIVSTYHSFLSTTSHFSKSFRSFLTSLNSRTSSAPTFDVDVSGFGYFLLIFSLRDTSLVCIVSRKKRWSISIKARREISDI